MNEFFSELLEAVFLMQNKACAICEDANAKLLQDYDPKDTLRGLTCHKCKSILGIVEAPECNCSALLEFVERDERIITDILRQVELDQPTSPKRHDRLTDAQYITLQKLQNSRCAGCHRVQLLFAHRNKSDHVCGLICQRCLTLLKMLSPDVGAALDRIDYHLMYGVRNVKGVSDMVMFARGERTPYDEIFAEVTPKDLSRLLDRVRDEASSPSAVVADDDSDSDDPETDPSLH